MKVLLTYDRDFASRIDKTNTLDYITNYTFLTDEFEKQGHELVELNVDDYFALLSGDNRDRSLVSKLNEADLILHSKHDLVSSLELISDVTGVKISPFETRTCAQNMTQILFFNPKYAIKTHGVTPISAQEEFDPRLKHNLEPILNECKVGTPKTYLQPEFPCFLKQTHSCRGQDVNLVKNQRELEQLLLLKLFEINGVDEIEKINPNEIEIRAHMLLTQEYVMQEPIDIPTTDQTHFRVLCYEDNVVGSALYYTNPKANNALGFIKGIPFGTNRRITKKEKEYLNAYNLTKECPPYGIIEGSEKIGTFCKKVGIKITGLDFVVDKKGNSYCIDINMDPGLDFFNITDFNGRSDTALYKLKQKAAQTYVSYAQKIHQQRKVA